MTHDHLVIDVSPARDFAQGHVPRTVNVPAPSLVQWAGFLVDYEQPLYLITDSDSLPDHLRALRSIGIDNVGGYFDSQTIRESGLKSESYEFKRPEQLQSQIGSGEVQLLDVRSETEFAAGHIPGAQHRFLGKLFREFDKIDQSKPIVAQCLSGGRSAIATSILQRAGLKVTDMRGGYSAWVAAGLEVTREAATI